MELECKGFGHPTPVVQWFVGDIPLIANDGRITIKETPKRADSGMLINGTIRIEKMDMDDSGEYVCIARSSIGFMNASVTVHVKGSYENFCIWLAGLCH